MSTAAATGCPHCHQATCEHLVYSGNDDIVGVLVQRFAKSYDMAKLENNRTLWENEIFKWVIPASDGAEGAWYTRTPEVSSVMKRLQITIETQAMFQ